MRQSNNPSKLQQLVDEAHQNTTGRRAGAQAQSTGILQTYSLEQLYLYIGSEQFREMERGFSSYMTQIHKINGMTANRILSIPTLFAQNDYTGHPEVIRAALSVVVNEQAFNTHLLSDVGDYLSSQSSPVPQLQFLIDYNRRPKSEQQVTWTELVWLLVLSEFYKVDTASLVEFMKSAFGFDPACLDVMNVKGEIHLSEISKGSEQRVAATQYALLKEKIDLINS